MHSWIYFKAHICTYECCTPGQGWGSCKWENSQKAPPWWVLHSCCPLCEQYVPPQQRVGPAGQGWVFWGTKNGYVYQIATVHLLGSRSLPPASHQTCRYHPVKDRGEKLRWYDEFLCKHLRYYITSGWGKVGDQFTHFAVAHILLCKQPINTLHLERTPWRTNSSLVTLLHLFN